jgi:hypothetical protein
MRKVLSVFALLSFAIILMSIAPALAQEGPKTGDIWICPSVSTHNPHGMWVVGTHGAYYILKPGTASPKWPDILNPTANLDLHASHVEDLAQVSAGWGLYKDLPTYPYFEGDAMVLPDGAVWGLTPGPQYISASQEIPLASSVFW